MKRGEIVALKSMRPVLLQIVSYQIEIRSTAHQCVRATCDVLLSNPSHRRERCVCAECSGLGQLRCASWLAWLRGVTRPSMIACYAVLCAAMLCHAMPCRRAAHDSISHRAAARMLRALPPYWRFVGP